MHVKLEEEKQKIGKPKGPIETDSGPQLSSRSSRYRVHPLRETFVVKNPKLIKASDDKENKDKIRRRR